MINHVTRDLIYRTAQHTTYAKTAKQWGVSVGTVYRIVREQNIIMMMKYAPAVYRNKLMEIVNER